MWRDVACLMGGFVAAYLIIKAVRSFFGGIGVALLFFGGVQVWATYNVNFTFVNDGGSTVYYRVKHNAGYDFVSGSVSGGATVGPSGYTDYDHNVPETLRCWWWTDYNAYLASNTGASSANETWTVSSSGQSKTWHSSGGYSVTNYNYQVCFTNTCSEGWENVRLEWSVGMGWVTNGATLWNPQDTACFNVATNGYLTVYAYKSGCGEFAGVYTNYGFGVMTTTVTNAPGPDTGGLINGATGSGSAAGNTPVPGTGTIPTNGPTADRMNADAVVRTLNNGFGILNSDLLGISGKLDGLGAGAGTNTDYSGKLEQIRTNTQNTALQLTNLTGGSLTNLGRLGDFFGTNFSGTGSYGGTNLSSWIAGGSNLVKGALTTDYGGLTNGIGWATNFTGPENAMQVDLGNGWTIDFDIFNSVTGLGLVVLQAVPFIRNTLEWLICFALFWVVMDRLDESLRVGLMGLKPGIGAGLVVDWIQRLVTAPIVVVAIGTLLLMIPTLCMTVWGTWSILSGSGLGSSGSGLLERVSSIGTGSAFGAALAEFAYRSLIWFPYDTLVVAIWTWLVAFFLGQYYIVFLYGTLWLASRMLPVFVIWSVWQTVDIQAGQVRFENFTGSTVALTNGAEIVQLPAGISEEVVLTDGDWWSGTNGFTLTSGFWGVRAMGSTNDVGIYFSAAKGYTGYEWWQMGMSVGFTVFGGAWAVAVVRQGLLIRVHE